MKTKFKSAFIKAALIFSELSYCNRRKVGAVIVKNDTIIAIGYNGTPAGQDNCCEDENGKTKPEVRHAEANALAKLCRSTESSIDSSLFVTTAPCKQCAIDLVNAGIKEVYYLEHYKHDEGLSYLTEHGIKTERIFLED